MKKVLFTVLLPAVLTGSSFAQQMGVYKLETVTGATYVPLTAGTVVSPGLVWYKVRFKIPLGFTSKLGGTPITHLSIVNNGMAIGTDTIGTINAFTSFLTTPLRDRWVTDYNSPIRYEVAGSAPNRIFKLEFFNAGFEEEHYTYGTMEDSVNVQYWLYESSDIFEIHYGGSKITYPATYFFSARAPVIGHLVNFKLIDRTVDKCYTLKESPAAPVVDSVTSLSGYIPSPASYPSEGTVYRFVPKSTATSVSNINAMSAPDIYPTQTTGMLTVRYTGEEQVAVTIRDAQGRELGKLNTTKAGRTIDLSSYPAGMYIMDLQCRDSHTMHKVFKL